MTYDGAALSFLLVNSKKLMTRYTVVTEQDILSVNLNLKGSQCSDSKCEVTLTNLRMRKITRVA